MRQQNQELTHVKHEFDPIFDENSEILILGTLPSVMSREQNFYYGHPQNRFWKLLARLRKEDIPSSVEEKKAFLAEMGIEASGLDNLITASYDLLGLISFLTDGKKECRAWTIRKGTKAPQAAGKIHSDFERGFIRASVIGYNDLEANNFDYAAVKAKGLQRTEGKEYVVHDGDVIEFLFNV